MEFAPPFESAAPPGRPLRILCAEDHEQMALLTKMLLECDGHYVEYVTDGLQAWDRVRMNPGFFDLIVTDNQMPHLTGLELVRRLRETEYGGAVIVHSSCVTADDAAAFTELGVARILRKPIGMHQLLTAVNLVRPR